MQLHPDDIFQRRERNGRVAVFLKQDALLAVVPSLTEGYLRKKARPGFLKSVRQARHRNQSIPPDTGAAWRYAKKKGTYWYDYERIPNRTDKKLPSLNKLLAKWEKTNLKAELSELREAVQPYLDRREQWLPAYGSCTEDQADSLAIACAVVQYAADYIGSRPPENDKSFQRNLARLVKREDWQYLPRTYRRLDEKIQQVVDGADVRDIIQLPRQGNKNAAKYDSARVKNWAVYLRSRPENYSNRHIWRKVRQTCRMTGEPCPSLSWMEHFLGEWRQKFLTGRGRYGSSRFGQDFTNYVPVAGAIHPGDCWQMDGTRFNFIPHQSADGAKRSLTIIVVRDVHSGDILGYHFDTKEDRWGYINALEMATAATGHLPYELVHDKFPGHNTDEWTLITKRMQHLGVRVTVSSSATSKAAVERGFGTLQDVFMLESKWYYGHGVKSSRPWAHRSPEYLARMDKEARREGFDFDHAWREASKVVEAYRQTPYSEYSRVRAAVKQSPAQLYEQGEKPWVVPCDVFRRVELFGTETTATIRNNGMIKLTIHRVDYHYQLDPDTQYEVIANYKRVAVCYDIGDLSEVYLFEAKDDVNREFLGTVQELRRIQMYGPEKDLGRLSKLKAKHKRLREQRAAELEEMIGEGSEVEALMAAYAAKEDVTEAENQWLHERVANWEDRRGTPRLPDLPAATDDENDGDDLQVIRRY